MGSAVVFWFDMLQQTCSRWQTRQEDVAFFQRYMRLYALDSRSVTFFLSFIGNEVKLYGNSSVPAQDSLRMLLTPSMRLEVNRIHALSQLQPAALLFYPPTRRLQHLSPLLNIAYFSLQFSPRNSLNGLPSGIFRRVHALLRSSIHSFSLHHTHIRNFHRPQPPQPQARSRALHRNRWLQRWYLPAFARVIAADSRDIR